MGMKLYLIVVFDLHFSNGLVMLSIKYLLAICISSLEKCLCLLSTFVFWLSFSNSLCSLCINPVQVYAL